MAEERIERQRRDHEADTNVTFSITLAVDDTVIGSICFETQHEHYYAQLGYWLGVPYWNLGYGMEAVKAVVTFGFSTLNLHRLYAPHFHDNPASGRVLQKAGTTNEGRLGEHDVRLGRRVDAKLYGMLKSEWKRR